MSLELFPEQQNLIERVLTAAEDDSETTNFRIIWGQMSGKSIVVKELYEKKKVLIFSTNVQEAKRDYPKADIYGYGIAPGDIPHLIKRMHKFNKVPDIIVLEDIDWSGMNYREVASFKIALNETIASYKIAVVLVLSSFNKPSITEGMFDGTGIEEKKATWEVNTSVSEEMFAPYFEQHHAKANRDFACI